MTSKVVLQMTFLTDQNKKVRISIPSPKSPVDSTAVTAAMNAIVTKNIFAFPQGNIVKAVGATEVQSSSSTVS